MTRIEAGDYLLPSNDAATIYRISRYEDGPSNGLDIPRDRMFWGVWKWVGLPDEGTVDPGNWMLWEMVASGLSTRTEAIAYCLTGEADA